MPTKNLKELRALARSRGLRGYSKLSRRELEKLLSLGGMQTPAAAEKTAKPATTTPVVKVKAKSASPRVKSAPVRVAKKTLPAAKITPPKARPAPALTPQWEWAGDVQRQSADEEQIESAKYAVVPPGSAAPRAEAMDLNEDIDNLPPVAEATLCLLPQKPGVLHGYWVLPPDSAARAQSFRLRLGRIASDVFEIIDEIPVSRERGRWYFHVDESTDMGEVYLQLGYYEPDGRFVIATRRGIARIPSLHASNRTDRLWWVSEEQFRAMYRRAGGRVHGSRLGWAASISSPGGAPSSDRLAWPGGISSRQI
ncbi:DUF4912 domain-containing protein [Sulfuricaulis limicola]|nr:DUF4912 domain-containing protein [Sulfuricaulis limicola]